MTFVTVDSEIARATARRIHAGQHTRSGELLIEHVERVACAVPADVRAIAYLHDVLEWADGAMEEIRELGLGDTELTALALLTRRPRETYRAYILRIARARGAPGAIARAIKMADLDDHLRQRRIDRSPDYAWGREQIQSSQLAHGETPSSHSRTEHRRVA